MKTFIKTFKRKFSDLDKSSRLIIEETPENKLFYKLGRNYEIFSIGEFILHSAGKVEQTFGGITASLWDDPFEWTLPEELSSKKKIFEYLDEVEKTTNNGLGYFQTDEDLKKEIQTPWGAKILFELLLDTTLEAEFLKSKAFTILQIIDGDNK